MNRHQLREVEKIVEGNEEFFISFDRFPGFQNATIEHIFKFERDGDEFHWPNLDVDIELDALRHPNDFP